MNINLGMNIKGMDVKGIQDKVIKKAVTRLGIEAQKHAMDTINTFQNAKGRSQGVDSGAFRDSIHVISINDGFGFKMVDGVPYGIYHEYGAEPHWLPFFNEDGTMTGLGEWAMRKFDLEGAFTVPGKRTKALKNPSRNQREEVLKKMGGIVVSLDEMAPFRKAVAYIKSIETKVFKEEMNHDRQ